MTAESSFTAFGAWAIIHETVHALDFRVGFIQRDVINQNRLASEFAAYSAQSVMDEYSGIKTGLYAPGIDALTRIGAIGSVAITSYLSTLYPE